MSSLVYLKSKSGNTVYVYLNEKGEDGKYRRRCIGHLDPVTGDIVRNREKRRKSSAGTRSYGINMMLRRISDSIGLTESLQIIFKDSWDSILSFAFYCLCEATPFRDMERWMEFNETPRMWPLTSEDIVSILKHVTEHDIDSFFKVWNKRSGDSQYVITSLSTERSVDKSSKLDFEKMFSTEIEMCYGLDSRLPIAYHVHPTMFRTVQDITSSDSRMEWVNGSNARYLVEETQALETGIDQIIDMIPRFIIEIPSDNQLFKRLVGENRMNKILDSSQVKTLRYDMRGKKVFVHIYYDPMKAELEISRFLRVIESCRFEIENQHYVTSHAPLYNKYFIITGRGIAELNSEAIMLHNLPAGYRMLISDVVPDPADTFSWMLRNDFSREMFDRMRNDSDLTSLKLFIESNLASRMFIQFVALILGTKINNIIRQTGMDETLNSLLFQMKNLMRVDVEGRKSPIMSEMNDHQKEIVDTIFSALYSD